ncbi:MAG: hypothetical protein FJZ61_00310 [Chlamydiae bacterium]|nr:hypothetical protein [Chlamydiota bacterium]
MEVLEKFYLMKRIDAVEFSHNAVHLDRLIDSPKSGELPSCSHLDNFIKTGRTIGAYKKDVFNRGLPYYREDKDQYYEQPIQHFTRLDGNKENRQGF